MALVTWGNFHLDPIPYDQADVVLPHFPAQLSPNGFGSIPRLDLVLAPTKGRRYDPFDFVVVASRHFILPCLYLRTSPLNLNKINHFWGGTWYLYQGRSSQIQ